MSWGVATQNGVSVSLASIVSLSCGATEFSPADLFTGGVPGSWYDPSDYSSLFQDSAGTTPVTAVEQPVGLMKDKSGNVNNALQATTAARPVLRARYNLLTYSEQFDNAAWTKSNTTVSANAVTAPDGTLTADKLVEDTVNSPHRTYYQTVFIAGTYTYTVYLKAAERTFAQVTHLAITPQPSVIINLTTGALTNPINVSAYSATSVGNGWWRVSITYTATVTTTAYPQVGILINATTGTYTGDGVSGIYVWGADVRYGTTSATYQRIAAATDYVSTGFLPYLAFDGVDDSLATSAINFTATDKMAVVAGLTKLSDAAQSVVAELSATIAANNGSFLLSAPNSAAANFNFSSKGTTQVDNTVTTYASPYTAVLAASGDIASGTNSVKVNGGTATTVTSSQGTGNYGNYAMYVGRRNSATLPFTGRIYQIVVCGKALSAAELASTEAYVNSKTGAY